MTGRIPPEVRAALPVARDALASRQSGQGIADAIVGALHAAGMLRVPEDDQPVPYALTERATATEAEPTSPAAQVAVAVQALHDPAVIGYVVGVRGLRLIMHPTTWQQWEDWQQRLNCDPSRTTYRGEVATAHGRSGDVAVDVTCHLDRLPKPAPAVTT